MNDKKNQLDKIENEILKLSSEYFKINNAQNFIPYISTVPVSLSTVPSFAFQVKVSKPL